METNYCLFIERRCQDGEDFTDLPFGNLEELTKVAEAALKVPYVINLRIRRKVQELDGCPMWGGPAEYERENPNIEGHYTTENQFKEDLRLQLQDEQLFRIFIKIKMNGGLL